MSGGGGGSAYYDNLNRLYGMQADQSEQLQGLANSTVYPAFKEMGNEARGYGSQANREKAAATSAADFASARDRGTQALTDQMASYGLNPGDATFQHNIATNNIAGAAADAAGRTGARDKVDQVGFARLQDFSSLGMGVPSAATQAANSAGNSASAAGSMWQNQQNSNANAWGNAVRGGIDLYGFTRAADGGYISHEPLRLKGGGYVQRFARGGVVGAMQNIQPPAPPPTPPKQASMTNQVAGPAGIGLMKYGKDAASGGGQAIQAAGQATGSPGMVEFGNGMAVPKGADPSVQQFFTSPDTVSYQMGGAGGANPTALATQQVDSVLPAAGLETTGSAATGVAADTVAGGAMLEAGGTAAAGGLGAAGAAIGTAMPYVGAALLAGSALGLFRDGGHVTPGANAKAGGKVSGPGGPKDDLIPAMLSDGEFVMPVGAVKKFGIDRLEKMRQAGLKFEKQLGIGQ